VRATFLATALKHPSPSLAIAAAKKATSRANAQTKSLVVGVVGVPAVAAVVVDTQAAVEAKNATNVVKLGTLLAIALKAVAEDMKVDAEAATVVAMVVDTAAVEEVEAEAVVVKPATLVADLDTCLATAPRAKSATTVSGLHAENSRWY
jgi:hypothetical protein